MSVENKKCPHCGAEIEENARFCLYCMTSLDEKEALTSRFYAYKRWLIPAAVFLGFLVVGAVLCLLLWKPEPKEQKPNPESVAGEQLGNENADGSPNLTPETSTDGDGADESVGNFAENPNGTGSSQVGEETNHGAGNPDGSAGNGTQGQTSSPNGTQTNLSGNGGETVKNPSNGSNSSSEKGTEENETEKTPESSENNSDSGNDTEDNTADSSQNSQQQQQQQQPEQQEPEQEEPAPKPSVTEAVYTYRQMKYGDDYHTNAAVTDDKIVLTGIQTPAADGIYHIPATIDGKTVIAIESSAFYNSGHALTIKKVYIPSTLKTIWGSAFVGCYNLTDVYLYGKSIYIDPWAFPTVDKRNGTLTIHCSSDCSNRDFRYYKNIASSYYDAKYVEWNG